MPNISDNPFVDMDSEYLANVRQGYSQCILEVANVGQTYQMNGRTWTAAQLPELRNTLQQVNQAIKFKAGQVHQFATPVFGRRN